MDTTKEYIKMCDCTEIQTQVESDSPYLGCDYGFKDGDRVIVDSQHNYWLTRDVEGQSRTFDVWLPRQDQIQDIMKFDEQGDEMDTYSLIGWFNDYCQNTVPSYPTVKTPEQMWLNFYMKEKFNKKWDGEIWQ